MISICPHRDGTHCAIAARLAGLERVTTATDAACEYCTTRATPPRDRNKVTCDLAAGALRLAGRDADAWALIKSAPDIYQPAPSTSERLQAIVAGTGPGSQLWRLLESLHVRHTATCPCLGFAEQMNAWGVAGCRLARPEIVEHMRTHARAYGWGTFVQAAGRAVLTGLAWRIDLTNPYGSLADESIRRAEASEREGSSPRSLPLIQPAETSHPQ
jgi:hypothetical protein